MASKANIFIDQGADFSVTIDVSNDANVAYDLTDHTVAAQMRKNYASSSAYTFSATHNDAGGQIVLQLSHTITRDIEPGRYLYDVEVTNSANTVTRVIEGVATVSPGITRI